MAARSGCWGQAEPNRGTAWRETLKKGGAWGQSPYVTRLPHSPNFTLINQRLVFPLTLWQAWSRLRPDALEHLPPPPLHRNLEGYVHIQLVSAVQVYLCFQRCKQSQSSVNLPQNLIRRREIQPSVIQLQSPKEKWRNSSPVCILRACRIKMPYWGKRWACAVGCSAIHGGGWAARGMGPPTSSFGDATCERAER